MARKKRATPEVNSSSMADIAFLLLIFFLVTTTIATDKGLTMSLPPKPDPNQPPPDINKNARNIFKILVNSQDKMLVEDEPMTDVDLLKDKVKKFVMNFGKLDEKSIALYNSLPQDLKSLSDKAPDSSDNPEEAVVSLKANRGTSYDTYIAILDQLQGAYYEIYGARLGLSAEQFRGLDLKNPEDKEKYEKAREGIPMNISIAEPDK